MIKFRSYREGLDKFTFFQDGKYYYTESCTRIITYNIDTQFNWDNAKLFTTKKDIKGQEIYEGDKLIDPNDVEFGSYIVELSEGCFFLTSYTDKGEKTGSDPICFVDLSYLE